MAFDPYRKWLGISSNRRPPTYYDLLGIEPGENDNDVILSALQQRRAFIQSKKGEGYDGQVRVILRQFDEAATTLLVTEFKNAYDRQLGLHLKRNRRGARRSYLPSWMETRVVRVYGEGSGIIGDVLGIVSIIFVAMALMLGTGYWLQTQTQTQTTESDSPQELTWMEKAAIPTLGNPDAEAKKTNESPLLPDELKESAGSAVAAAGEDTSEQTASVNIIAEGDSKSDQPPAQPSTTQKKTEQPSENKFAKLDFGPPPAMTTLPRLIRAIDDLVAKEGVTEDSPGVAIFMMQPGQWVFIKGYGRAKPNNGAPITTKTLFETASLTKPMTATAVLLLHDEGKLSVDDDVRKFIPELPAYDAERPIRIKDLLSHVSGLPDYMEFKDVPARHKGFWVSEDYADAFAKNLKSSPLHFPPGEKFEYNNSNYMLLSVVISRVSGKSFADFMRDEIFARAGMKDTFVYENQNTVRAVKDRHPSATGYWKADDGKWQPGWGLPPDRREEMLTAGDGGVWTNLEDMGRWDVAWRFGRFLQPATAMNMVIPSKTRDGQTNGYGLGFTVYPNNVGGLEGFGHSGYWNGFRSEYYRDFVTNRSTVILSNREDFDTSGFWFKLNDAANKFGIAKKK